MTKRLYIDPGHGGGNRGTRVGDRDEKHVTLDFAQRLDYRLRGSNCVVQLGRVRDQLQTWEVRSHQADAFDADLVMSLHCNAHADMTIRGGEAYYWHSNDYTRHLAMTLAGAFEAIGEPGRIRDVMPDDPRDDTDNWLEAPRTVLTAFRQPVLLAECLYASNPANLLTIRDRPDLIVSALALTVERWIAMVA